MKFPKYYLAAISAFIIWGFFSFGLKPLHHYPSLDILFYRVFTCTLIMIVCNILFRRKILKETQDNFLRLQKKEKRSLILLIVGSSLLLSANWFFFIFVMNHVSVKAASFAYLVCPILTTVLAYFILKEKLSALQWAAVFLSIASCVLLSYNNISDVLYSIIVAATYALYLVLQKLMGTIDRFLLLTLQITITTIILLPFYPFYSGTVPSSPVFYGYILLIAIVFTILPMLLNLFALKGINSSTVGILLYINPLIAFALAIFYYKEDISVTQISAYSVILISIIIFNIGSYIRTKRLA